MVEKIVIYFLSTVFCQTNRGKYCFAFLARNRAIENLTIVHAKNAFTFGCFLHGWRNDYAANSCVAFGTNFSQEQKCVSKTWSMMLPMFMKIEYFQTKHDAVACSYRINQHHLIDRLIRT